MSAKCQKRKSPSPANPLNIHLSTDLDNPVSGQLEIAARIVGILRQQNEQPVLPQRHSRSWIRADRASRQEERCRHYIETPALLSCDRECFRHIWAIHESEAEQHAGKLGADRLDGDAIGIGDMWNILDRDGEHNVLLMQHLVVLDAVE